MSFDGRVALIQGNCQMGKSGEIALAAWLTVFKYKALPIVFVKNAGGHEAANQLAGNIRTFNKHIDSMFAQMEGKKARQFHLVPKLDLRDYFHGSLDAQVLILLANPSVVRRVKEYIAPKVGVAEDGKLNMVLIFDEDDLNTKSANRDECVLEQELFGPWSRDAGEGDDTTSPSLREQVKQVISVTATIGAIALSETKPMQVKIMPVQRNYWGLSPLVPQERRPKWKEVQKEDMATEEDMLLPQALVTMVQDMLDSPVECTGLLHLETRIGEHKKLQESLANKFAAERLVVLTHNGGQDYQTRKSIGVSSQGGDSAAVSPYVVESRFPLTALGSEAVRQRLHEFLQRILPASRHHSSGSLERFCKDMKIMDVLTLLLEFRVEERGAGYGNITVAILSGHAGGRGTTFRDASHQSCLTDMYLSKDPNLSGEHLVQVANRISGIFRNEKSEPWSPARLNWWTSKEIHDSVNLHMSRLTALTDVLQTADGKPLRQILQDTPELVKLPPLPKGFGGAPMFARRNVEAGFNERQLEYSDPGNKPLLFGGGDARAVCANALQSCGCSTRGRRTQLGCPRSK